MTWGWADKGAKGHWSPDATGHSKCGKANVIEEAEIPAKDRCAACRKAFEVDEAVRARAAVNAAPTPVVNLRVRTPPGGTVCSSSVHAGEAVRATVEGTILGLDGLAGSRAYLCGWCAHLMIGMGFLDPDEQVGICVRCAASTSDPHHTPCCSSDYPHGRPLCCHCYGVTHHVEGVPCH